MLEKLKNKNLSFYFQLAAILLAVIAFFYIANIGNPMPEQPKQYKTSVVMIIAGVVLEALALVFAEKRIYGYIALVAAICLSTAMVFFAIGSVMSVIDYIYHIVMWGDPAQFGAIMLNGSLLLVGTGFSIATCFMK